MSALPVWRCRVALGAIALAIYLSGTSSNTRLLAGLERVAQQNAAPRGLRDYWGVQLVHAAHDVNRA